MVAMARALAAGPRVLLLDEPTEGLQPSYVDRILETVSELRATGTAMLLVEQKVEAALAVAEPDRLHRERSDPRAHDGRETSPGIRSR